MMNRIKTLFLALLAVAFLASCNEDNAAKEDAANNLENPTAANATAPEGVATEAANQAPTGPTTSLQFAETEFEFGTVDEGEIVNHTFKFTNTGNEPLIISNAKGSCGCTVPKWPREPIAPGGTGEVAVEFNSKGKKGARTQKVTLTANTNPPQTFLTLKGNVTPAEGGTTAQ